MIGTNVIHKPWTPKGIPTELMFGKVISQNGNMWIIEWDNVGCTEHSTKEVEAKKRNYERWMKTNVESIQKEKEGTPTKSG